MQPNSGKKSFVWLWITTAVIILGAGVWYGVDRVLNTNEGNSNTSNRVVFNQNTQVNQNTNAPTNTNATILNGNVNTNSVPAGWKTYTDPEFGFSFNYPEGWAFATYPNGTISVVPPSFQEPVPLFRALAGSTEEMLAWVQSNWIDPAGDRPIKTPKTYTFSNFSGTVYSLKEKDFLSLADLDSYTLATQLQVLTGGQFSKYVDEFRSILVSLRR